MFDSDDDSVASMIERWRDTLLMIKENDPEQKELFLPGDYNHIQKLTDEHWEELGRDISKNTHLSKLKLCHGALNDNRMSFLFRGLTKSNSIKELILNNNYLSAVGVRNMVVPFLQNATNLMELDLSGNRLQSAFIGVDPYENYLQSEGFNFLLRALRDSPIEELICKDCSIEWIEIDIEHIPRHLKLLNLCYNSVESSGCEQLVKLLQGEDATLECLYLEDNKIDNRGVDILIDALRSNTTLTHLDLTANHDRTTDLGFSNGITDEGKVKLLKLVNDVSSITATLQSNHTLVYLGVEGITEQSHDTATDTSSCESDDQGRIQTLIDKATDINSDAGSPEAAGREKVIQTQLNSEARAELAELQDWLHHIQVVRSSVYSEIDPLHFPEVLSLVGHRHGQSELYLALKDSIAGLMSTVNRKAYIRQQIAYHEEKLKELSTELAAIEAAEGAQGDGGRNKRHRAC